MSASDALTIWMLSTAMKAPSVAPPTAIQVFAETAGAAMGCGRSAGKEAALIVGWSGVMAISSRFRGRRVGNGRFEGGPVKLGEGPRGGLACRKWGVGVFLNVANQKARTGRHPRHDLCTRLHELAGAQRTRANRAVHRRLDLGVGQ